MQKNKALDSNLDFAGMGGTGYSRNSDKLNVNQHTGYANDGTLMNVGRGPTKGNTGGKATPSTSPLPANIKIKNPDYINGGAQVRTPGGTRERASFKDPHNINVGRGPTKGNS